MSKTRQEAFEQLNTAMREFGRVTLGEILKTKAWAFVALQLLLLAAVSYGESIGLLGCMQ